MNPGSSAAESVLLTTLLHFVQSSVLNGIKDRMAQLNNGHMKCPLSRREALPPGLSAFILQSNPQADKTRCITHFAFSF